MALAGILTVPLYAKYLGAEAYGIVGVYAMLQAWFQALDIGLSTTLSRESSLYHADHAREKTFLRVKRIMEKFFYAAGAGAIVFFAVSKDWIADHWLNVKSDSIDEVKISLLLIGVVIAVRWCSCLYRGIVTGFEQQVWLGQLNVCVATCRFIVPLPVVVYVDNRLTVYFAIQIIVALLEWLALFIKSNRSHKALSIKNAEKKEVNEELKGIFKFTTGVALTSMIWVVMTQTDKLVLSKFISLEDFGKVSMAILLANGINMVSGPVSMALLPRLTRIATQDHQQLLAVYRQFTQIVAAIIFPIGFAMFFCSRYVIYGWTGDMGLAENIGVVMGGYAIGNSIMAINSFGYYLQYAKGNIALHVIGNVITVLIYVPLVSVLTYLYGAVGSALVWAVINLLYFVFWMPRIHSLLAKEIAWVWVRDDVVRIAVAAVIPILIANYFMPDDAGRLQSILIVIAVTLFSMVGSCFAAPTIRKAIVDFSKKNKHVKFKEG